MRALVVDDEALARRRLSRMLERIAGVTVVAQACDGHEALERLAAPGVGFDVAFLDVRMPGLDGLAVAHAIDVPAIVFVTAHDEHALAAFEVGATDYLLKPVTQARLERALERVRGRGRADLTELRATVSRLSAGSPGARPLATPATTPAATPVATGAAPVRVRVREAGTIRVFDATAIPRFHAADKYTVFRGPDGDEHVLDESLNELELRLRDHGFVRVHRAELVDLRRAVALHTRGGASLELDDGQRAAVARRMVAAVRRELG